MPPFKLKQPTERRQRKLRSLVLGKSKAGKTYTALALAYHLVELGSGTTVGVIDTQTEQAQHYQAERCQCSTCRGSGIVFQFPALDLDREDHVPNRFTDALAYMEAQGVDVLVVDSVTHEWSATLRWADENKTTMKNKGSAWNDPKKAHEAFVDRLLNYPGHVIATCRTKEKHDVSNNMASLGEQPIQDKEIEYQFDLVLHMFEGGTCRVQGARSGRLQGARFTRPGADLARGVVEWLSGDLPPDLKPAKDAVFARAQALGNPAALERVGVALDKARTAAAVEEIAAGVGKLEAAAAGRASSGGDQSTPLERVRAEVMEWAHPLSPEGRAWAKQALAEAADTDAARAIGLQVLEQVERAKASEGMPPLPEPKRRGA